MSSGTPFDAVVAKILDGSAPDNVRGAAARGALPLPRPVLLRLQVGLLDDADAAIAQDAKATLDGLDANTLGTALGDPACPAEVLAFFARRASRDEALAERLAFHPAVPPGALEILAASGSAPVVELVLTNQERLLAQPGLLERLMANPALRPGQRGRILELLERVARHRTGAEPGSPAEVGAEPADDDGPLDIDEAARLLEVDVGELMSASEILGGEEFEHSDDLELRSTYQKILELNAAQKAILAMKGGREERMILVRDSNRTVALGVLRNGRLTDREIESFAKMRNVTEDVLRHIGTNREWTKRYSVITSLVNNPRTPQGVSTNFVGRLTTRDLKELDRNRDVPELIRRMAKRVLDTRTQRQKASFKRK